MKVVAVVLSYNSKDYIGECLESLSKLETGPHSLEVVVVDNDSTDGSVKFLSQKYPQIHLIRNPANMGYAGGNNTGFIYALDSRADFVWLVNPDVTVAPDSLLKFMEGAAKHTREGIFGCKVFFAPGHETHPERYTKDQLGKVIWYAGGLMDWRNVYGFHRGVDQVDGEQFNFDTETDYVSGACMFIKRSVLEEVGLLDPRLFLYYEENDFCQRAKRGGFKCVYLCLPTAWHKNAQATGLGSPLQDYFIIRNRLFFGLRYAPLYTKQALLRESWRLYQTGRPWQKKGVVDFYTGRFGAGSYQPD